MEVLRPSTPMPLGRALTGFDCYQMQRHSSDSLPPLQPLIEENNSKRLCTRRNQVCQATRLKPRRHIVSSGEGERVGILALSPKMSADLCKGDRSKTVLPELNSEKLLAGKEESNTLFIESTMEFKRRNSRGRLSPVRTRNINQYRPSSVAKNDSSSQSSNGTGLPTVAGKAKNILNINSKPNTTALQKHIEQQEKDYDSATIKADIFHRWLKSQQE